MSDAADGMLGDWLPHKAKCRCTDCQLERSQASVAELEQEVERLKRKASNEEQAHLQTIDERDKAEDALSNAYWMATGCEAIWSNLFDYDDALADIRTKVSECDSLKAELAAANAKIARLSMVLNRQDENSAASLMRRANRE